MYSDATVHKQPRPARALACVSCSQRKVKCDRGTPCSNCVKSRIPCMPSSLPSKPRRRRFAEKNLLDRLRRYEDLLREHNVAFDPLHEEFAATASQPLEQANVMELESLDNGRQNRASPSTDNNTPARSSHQRKYKILRSHVPTLLIVLEIPGMLCIVV
jgi:hypothetical protein